MEWKGLLGLLAAVVIAAAVGGVLASFVSTNGLFTGSDFVAPAAVTLGLVVAFVVALIALAFPPRRWFSSPYW